MHDAAPDAAAKLATPADAATSGGQGVPSFGPCARSFAEYCDGTCETFDQAVAAAVRLTRATSACAKGANPSVTVAECGELRVVWMSGGFGGYGEYFDKKGRMVAATRAADYNEFCDGGSFSADYGPVPTCTERVTKKLCPEHRTPACTPGDPLCAP